jgi:predicted metalloprotease
MRLACLLIAALLLLGGCGADDAVDDVRSEARQLKEKVDQYRDRADELGKDAGKIAGSLRRRVEEALADLRKAVPSASLPTPRSDREAEDPIELFLTRTLRSVDTYWTQTLKEAGLPEPRVRYAWVPQGRATRSGCGAPADEHAAFYCPSDDTIYVGKRIAAEIWSGASRNFPGEAVGAGKAIGDFGLAYVVAHEYAHNIQNELGIFQEVRTPVAKPFELQADCFAGTWGNSVYREGQITEEDVQEAVSTAMAAGDFEFGNPQHHGTPEERRDAWLLGWTTGDPGECSRFLAV